MRNVAMRRLRITIDQEKCVGSTMCVNIAHGVFALDDSNKSSVRDPEGNTEEKILEAAESCPVSAITVEDAETGERLFP
jgi:ferredoxin